jgi:5-enolpyruvylshikimate-3-phosphate synthase
MGIYPAFLDLEPWAAGVFRFDTPLPGSKSLTLRDCAIAALADGVSIIRYPGECDDYWRMKDCLRKLGSGRSDAMASNRRVETAL